MQTQELSFTERRDWLRLARTPNVGPVAFRDLLRRYKTAGAALDALPDLIRRKSITPPSLETIEDEMARSDELGIRIIAACEPDYPDFLRAVDPTPPLISVWGQTELLHRPCVAIIGSRNASAMGQKFAAKIATDLGAEGYTIVSGLARGIDTAAHTGALKTGTVGVLGGGVDHIYPRQNTELFHAMREHGALVSESPLGYRATARDFPRRNRIISGLSKGVVVIEAAERSGTLITARYALEQNRDVMAAPGSPLDPRTQGCNRLIQQGAALVQSVDDILTVLNTISDISVNEPAGIYDAPTFDWAAADDAVQSAKPAIAALLSPTPTPRDDIIRLSGLPIAVAAAALLEMELNQDICVEADGRIATNFDI